MRVFLVTSRDLDGSGRVSQKEFNSICLLLIPSVTGWFTTATESSFYQKQTPSENSEPSLTEIICHVSLTTIASLRSDKRAP